jgi:hypothetical protein
MLAGLRGIADNTRQTREQHKRTGSATARQGGIYLPKEGGGIAGEVLQTKSRRHFRAAARRVRKFMAMKCTQPR